MKADGRRTLSVLFDLERGYKAPNVDRIDGERYRRALGLELDNGQPVARIDMAVPPAGLEWTDVAAREFAAESRPPARGLDCSRRQSKPLVSVVVPTVLERTEGLIRCLDSVLASVNVEIDLIVVDNRPLQIDVPEITPDRYRSVRVVHEPKRGISAARNAGVRAARGDIVAFTDDDVEVTPWWLSALACSLSLDANRVAAVGLVHPARLDTEAAELFETSGAHSESILASYVYRGLAMRHNHGRKRSEVIRHPGGDGEPVIHSLLQAGGFGMGCNMAFRRSALIRRPFDETLGTGTRSRGGEDIARLMQVLLYEGEIAYEPSAIILHDHRDTMHALRRQMFAYGCGYSAALTSLVLSDLRLLPILGAGALPALGRFFRSDSARKSDRIESPEWSRLAQQEFRGLLVGPYEYARAAIAAMVASRSQPSPATGRPPPEDYEDLEPWAG